jgi:hypothetical protein
MACPGNNNELCGAGNFLSIYNTGNLTVYQAPAAQKTGLPGSWQYQGCFTDNVNNVRALFWQIILTHNNTATSCLGLCQKYGYMAAGMEYGDEVSFFLNWFYTFLWGPRASGAGINPLSLSLSSSDSSGALNSL